MNVFVIPSWYPSPNNPISGIFVKEEVECISEISPDISIVVSLDGGEEYYMNPRQPLRALVILFNYFRARGGGREVRKNLYEITNPQLKWPALILGGNIDRLLYAHRENFLRARAKIGAPDLIHAHVTYPAGWIAMKLAQEFGLPYIIKECMGPFPFRTRKFLNESGKLTRWIREPLEKASEVIAMSPQLADSMVAFGLRRPTVVPYPVDERRFELCAPHMGDDFVFFTLCALTPEKGIPDLLRALPEALRKRPSLLFRIGGSGQLRKTYEDLARSLGVDHAVRWLGSVPREEVPWHFSQCNAFIMLSHLETFGMVYAESIASGRPVIATRCGGAEFILNDKNGLLVDVADINKISEAIVKMVDEVDGFNSIEIRNDFLARFSRVAVVRQIVECYKKVIVA